MLAMMSGFSFIHAADIHLDSGFAGVSSRSPEAAMAARDATRRAFTALIDAAIARRVAFVLIAGDLYDSAPKDVGLSHFLRREAGRLERSGIALVILHGNHDFESELAGALPMPPNVHVFGSGAPETRTLPGPGVAIHGQSFPERHVARDLSLDYPPPVDGLFNIGMLHTSAGGYQNHATYAPCAPEALARKGYDYWALGHVHEAAALVDDPPVMFSGCLQGRSIRETGAKGAWLVRVVDGRPATEFLTLDVVRWHRITCDLSGAVNEEEVETRIREGLAAAAGARPAFVRLELKGDTAMDGWLRQLGRGGLLDRAEGIAAALEDVYIEKLRLNTAPPVAADPVTIAPLVDALRLACEDPALHEQVAALEASVRGRVPGRAEVEPAPGGVAGIIAEARRLLLARADPGDAP